MAGTETSIEVTAADPEKKEGSIECSTNGRGVGSTLKRTCCVFIVSVFLATALLTGYYIVDFEDHFEVFKVNGVRYGADYGHNGTNSSLKETDHDQWCTDRRCCHPTNGVSDEVGQQCWDLTQSECCDLIAQDICDWNCDDDMPNDREDHVVRDGRKRNKLCGGHSAGQGEFSEEIVLDEDSLFSDQGPPRSALDLQKRDGLSSEDECGDVFLSLLDDETAEFEMEHFGEIASEELAADDVEGSRRLQVIYGVIDSDSREAMESKLWPQDQIGLIKFESYNRDNKQYKTHICSGTKVTQKHILTAAHCCHSGVPSVRDQFLGRSGDWYSNFRWYPGAVSMSDVSSSNEHYIAKKTVFTAWIDYSNHDYDICWLHLSHSIHGHMGFGWSNEISTSWAFNVWGYPGDKWNKAYQSNQAQIKWGHDDCTQYAVLPNRMFSECDAGKAMSGAGLWLQSNNIVYCVLSSYRWGYRCLSVSQCNVCARITPDKFNTMYDNMARAGGWGNTELI